MNETTILVRSLQTLVPEPCYTRIFTNYDFFNGECFKILLSKWLGFSIILGSVLVKLPQILKISNARSGDGINIWSVLFELIAISASVSYGFAKQFPFSSYGEGMFLAIQTSLVMFLVIYFSGNMLGAFLFLTVYGLSMSYLLSPLVPMSVLAGIQGMNIIIVILSKLLQAYTNYSNGSTGQLSAITVVLVFMGSTVRIFTSIQETGDQLTVITYLIASICNAVLVSQMIYYGRKNKKTKKTKKA